MDTNFPPLLRQPTRCRCSTRMMIMRSSLHLRKAACAESRRRAIYQIRDIDSDAGGIKQNTS